MARVFLLSLCMAVVIFVPHVVGQESPALVPAAGADQRPTADSLGELETVVEQYVDKGQAVGAELLIIQKGQTLYHKSFGFSNLEDKRPWKNDTICNIRSMTKPITSAAAQILIDRKLLTLDDPVAKHLESFDNEKSKSITVRQVLTHRSGLPTTSLMNPYQYSSLAKQVAAAGEKGPHCEPGSTFWYSDTGTDVVGALIEKISGEPLHEFVKREIFEPLGMTNTLYGIDAADNRLSLAANGYFKGAKGWARFWDSEKPLYPFAWGSQTVYSTTTDYAKFLKMIMDRGRIGERQLLSPAAVSRMLEPVSRLKMMGSDAEYPTGFRNLETYYGQMMVTHHVIGKAKENPVVIGHSGSDGTNAWAWPEQDLIILYFTQSRGGPTPLRIEWPIDRLIIHPGQEWAEEKAPDRLQPYLGTYIANYDSFDNEEFTVTVRNGKLVLDVPSQMAFELKEPDKQGYWAFAIAPKQVKATFDRNKEDVVVGLRLHQAGKVYEVPRQGTARAKELSRENVDEKPAQQETTPTVKLQQVWAGHLDIGAMKPLMQFRIVTTEAGETAAYFDSVSEGRTGFDATWSIDGDILKFDVAEIKLKFHGTLNDARDSAEGTWSQGGREFPLTLKKNMISGLNSDPPVDDPDVSGQDRTGAVPDDFSERLLTLDRLLEKERVKNKIPGFAIAIVKDDEVVFSKGYGVANLELKTPVETDTLFAIGSSTKAFTGTLIGMLVDEGKMQWDDPVTTFLPDFNMKVKVEAGSDGTIRIRDLLCHRTGFNRMGILWASGSLTPEEIILQAAQAEPYADFQDKFLYNNVMYMAAGLSAGIAAESNWDALIADKIFKPLEMLNTLSTIRDIQGVRQLSRGYLWDKDKQELIHLPMRSLDSIAASGSIISNVKDMAQWLRFQLAKGRFNNQILLSEEQHAETWKSQIKVAGRVNYGFGWFLRQWKGRLVVEHGGNTDGFSAQVALMPDLNTGYVLLTNLSATPLRQDSINLVFDALFGEVAHNIELKGVDTDSLVGNYIGSFGPYFDQTLEVSMKNGKLMFDVPSQKTFELLPPDDDGKWYFAKTNKIAIAFNKNEEGHAVSITMYQAGMTPEFIREGVKLNRETPSSETAPLLGKYRDENGGKEVEVGVRNGRLFVDGGKSGFTLLPRDENGKWAMRANPARMQLRFNKTDDGTIKSMTRFQGDRKFEMLRVSETNPVPMLDELLAKIREGYGAIENADVVGIRMKGTGDFVNQGAKGTVELIFSNSGQHSTRRNFGKMATIVEAFDGEKGFSDTNVGRYQELSGQKLKLLELSHPLWFLRKWFPGDWKQNYQGVSITEESEVGGQKTLVISLSGENVADRKLYIDANSGLILKEETVWIGDSVGEVPIEIIYSDYRDVNGIQLPFKMVTDNRFLGKFAVQFESAEVLSELPIGAFVVTRSQ